MSASWKIKTLPQPVSEDHIRRLAAELQVSPITVRLLLLRGVETPEAMHRFLCPGLRYLLPLE
jgi:single-stranded-DNA-specific exonuclease